MRKPRPFQQAVPAGLRVVHGGYVDPQCLEGSLNPPVPVSKRPEAFVGVTAELLEVREELALLEDALLLHRLFKRT